MSDGTGERAPRVTWAHNLMTSSSQRSTDGQRTDQNDGRRTDGQNGRQTDQNAETSSTTNSAPAAGDIIQNLLSSNNTVPPTEFTLNGTTYRRSSVHKRVTYKTKNAILNDITQDLNISLIDRSCNGGFLGEDARILSIKDNYFADVIGMNNSKVLQAPIGTGCMKINTLQGPIIGIFNQYATGGKGHTIHSALQMEAFGLMVDDKS